MTIKSRTNTAAQPVTKSNPNPRPNPNPATKQYAIVQSQLNIVTCPTYPQKFTRDNVVAPFVQTSIVIATLPKNLCANNWLRVIIQSEVEVAEACDYRYMQHHVRVC